MEKKFEELAKVFTDENEAKKLLDLSPADAADYLRKTYNLEFSVEELKDVAAGIKASAGENGEELSEDALETVAGGANSGAYTAGKYIGKVVKVGGVALGLVKGAIAIGLISW